MRNFATRLRETPNANELPGAVVQLVRMRACHARGRGFEPHPHRRKPLTKCEGFFVMEPCSSQVCNISKANPGYFCNFFKYFIFYSCFRALPQTKTARNPKIQGGERATQGVRTLDLRITNALLYQLS